MKFDRANFLGVLKFGVHHIVIVLGTYARFSIVLTINEINADSVCTVNNQKINENHEEITRKKRDFLFSSYISSILFSFFCFHDV